MDFQIANGIVNLHLSYVKNNIYSIYKHGVLNDAIMYSNYRIILSEPSSTGQYIDLVRANVVQEPKLAINRFLVTRNQVNLIKRFTFKSYNNNTMVI